MFVFLCLISTLLFTGGRADETGVVACSATNPCPEGFRCVDQLGCVSISNNEDRCKCPATPCAWPFKCDCQGGCKATQCQTTADCGQHLVNPRNKCQVQTCDRDTLTCVASAAQCRNCNPLRGCPVVSQTNRASLAAVEEAAGADEPDFADAEETGLAVVDEEFSVEKHHNQQVDDNGTPGKNNGWVIFLIVFICIAGVVLLGVFIYAAYVQWPSKKKSNTAA